MLFQSLARLCFHQINFCRRIIFCLDFPRWRRDIRSRSVDETQQMAMISFETFPLPASGSEPAFIV